MKKSPFLLASSFVCLGTLQAELVEMTFSVPVTTSRGTVTLFDQEVRSGETISGSFTYDTDSEGEDYGTSTDYESGVVGASLTFPGGEIVDLELAGGCQHLQIGNDHQFVPGDPVVDWMTFSTTDQTGHVFTVELIDPTATALDTKDPVQPEGEPWFVTNFNVGSPDLLSTAQYGVMLPEFGNVRTVAFRQVERCQLPGLSRARDVGRGWFRDGKGFGYLIPIGDEGWFWSHDSQGFFWTGGHGEMESGIWLYSHNRRSMVYTHSGAMPWCFDLSKGKWEKMNSQDERDSEGGRDGSTRNEREDHEGHSDSGAQQAKADTVQRATGTAETRTTGTTASAEQRTTATREVSATTSESSATQATRLVE